MSDRISTLLRFIEEDPADPFPRYALALEWKSAGDYERAYNDLLRIIENQPDYLPVYYQAGQLAELLNNLPAAVLHYKSGIDLAIKQKANHPLGELRTALSLISDEEE